jgi:uncharacterized membrane protein YidH (DUF202 family)
MTVYGHPADIGSGNCSKVSENSLSVFEPIIAEGITSQEEMDKILDSPALLAGHLDKLWKAGQLPKDKALSYLSSYFGSPFLEYDEGLVVPPNAARMVDLEELKRDHWVPLSLKGDEATVAVCNPRDSALCDEIRRTLKVQRLRLIVALQSDLVRIVESNQDINPNFPHSAGRTPLARLRTYLADYRTLLAQYRTSLAQGRTGLAFIRTGVSFMTIGLVLVRVFGLGYMSILEFLLVGLGVFMTVDGLMWHLPTRKIRSLPLSFTGTEHTFGTTILMGIPSSNEPVVVRTEPITGAEELRTKWARLTTVMKRRFLASDRTDLAEERTVLASYRTVMARSRTGLAFTRTGVSFIGLGVALLRQFPGGLWVLFFGFLILLGLVMVAEGLHWYFPARQASKESVDAVKKVEMKASIWDFMFRRFGKQLSPDDLPPTLVIKGSHAPGIWGTTGLALERTLIAERRNVKSRLRMIMARSRTGMAFIRTGSSMFSIGLGLLVYFGFGNILWTLFDFLFMLIGVILMADGFSWHLPAERIRKQFPYCYGDMEIVLPDYARPAPLWKKVVFSHEDL